MAGGWKEYQWEESERSQEREIAVNLEKRELLPVHWSGMRQDLQVQSVMLERDVDIEW